jgi:hypothetical protein
LIAFRHYPLPFHDNAEPAAKAAIAAQKQGKFWEFHDKIFEQQDNLSAARLDAIAKELKLDLTQFKKDMNSRETQLHVAGDKFLASKAAIDGTPAFLINGTKMVGALPFPTFKSAIDTELSKVEAMMEKGKTIAQARGEVSAFNMQKTLDPNSGGIETLMRVEIDGAPGKGVNDPLVALVAFSDFQ